MQDLMSISTNEISKISTEDLRQMLRNGLALTAKNLAALAQVWAELAHRGEDLTEFRSKVPFHVPLIAAGRLAAEAVVAFIGNSLHLKYLDGMPLEMQRRLADGEPIPVMLPGEDQPESMPLVRVPRAALEYVIADDGTIRTPREQKLARKEIKPKKRVRICTPIVEREARTIKIGKTRTSIELLLGALADAAGARGYVIDSAAAPAKTCAGKFTDEEKQRIIEAAKAHNLELPEFVRRCVMAWLT